MKVFVDTESLYFEGGIGVYTLNLIKGISGFSENCDFFSAYSTLSTDKFEVITSKLRINNINIPFKKIFCPGRIACKFPGIVSKLVFSSNNMPDIIHATSQLPPLWLDIKKIPLIITIHDLAFIRHPGKEYVPLSNATDPDLIKKFAHRADAIISVSNFTKKEIVELLGVSPSKIHVTYQGSQWAGMNVKDGHPEFLNENGLVKGGYFLAVGTISSRKNYETLLDAFSSFHERYPKAKLVIVGSRGWACERIMEKIVSTPNVLWLRNVSAGNLRLLYRNARAFFMISHYEGFGIPLLEAMEAALPCCYAGGSSMDEIAGNTGVKVNSENINAVAECMKSFWINDALCSEMGVSAKKQAVDFSWEKTAAKTYSIYRMLCG